jgi:hypothetical protein
MSKDSEVINIRDFMDHETRISLVENAILHIANDMAEIKSEIKELKSEISVLRKEGLTCFKWAVNAILGLYGIAVTALIALVVKLVWG